MASASITLLQKDLDAVINATINLHKQAGLMKRIGRALHSDTMLNFRNSRSPDGTPWLPLKHRQGQPLRDTGRLQRSITWTSNHNTATVGTNVIYARAHNDGIPGKLPQRQFLGISSKQVKLVNTIADRWLQEILDGKQFS
jgi:phage virion morphogenesis protein